MASDHPDFSSSNSAAFFSSFPPPPPPSSSSSYPSPTSSPQSYVPNHTSSSCSISQRISPLHADDRYTRKNADSLVTYPPNSSKAENTLKERFTSKGKEEEEDHRTSETSNNPQLSSSSSYVMGFTPPPPPPSSSSVSLSYVSSASSLPSSCFSPSYPISQRRDRETSALHAHAKTGDLLSASVPSSSPLYQPSCFTIQAPDYSKNLARHGVVSSPANHPNRIQGNSSASSSSLGSMEPIPSFLLLPSTRCSSSSHNDEVQQRLLQASPIDRCEGRRGGENKLLCEGGGERIRGDTGGGHHGDVKDGFLRLGSSRTDEERGTLRQSKEGEGEVHGTLEMSETGDERGEEEQEGRRREEGRTSMKEVGSMMSNSQEDSLSSFSSSRLPQYLSRFSRNEGVASRHEIYRNLPLSQAASTLSVSSKASASYPFETFTYSPSPPLAPPSFTHNTCHTNPYPSISPPLPDSSSSSFLPHLPFEGNGTALHHHQAFVSPSSSSPPSPPHPLEPTSSSLCPSPPPPPSLRPSSCSLASFPSSSSTAISFAARPCSSSPSSSHRHLHEFISFLSPALLTGPSDTKATSSPSAPSNNLLLFLPPPPPPHPPIPPPPPPPYPSSSPRPLSSSIMAPSVHGGFVERGEEGRETPKKAERLSGSIDPLKSRDSSTKSSTPSGGNEDEEDDEAFTLSSTPGGERIGGENNNHVGCTYTTSPSLPLHEKDFSSCVLLPKAGRSAFVHPDTSSSRPLERENEEEEEENGKKYIVEEQRECPIRHQIYFQQPSSSSSSLPSSFCLPSSLSSPPPSQSLVFSHHPRPSLKCFLDEEEEERTSLSFLPQHELLSYLPEQKERSLVQSASGRGSYFHEEEKHKREEEEQPQSLLEVPRFSEEMKERPHEEEEESRGDAGWLRRLVKKAHMKRADEEERRGTIDTTIPSADRISSSSFLSPLPQYGESKTDLSFFLSKQDEEGQKTREEERFSWKDALLHKEIYEERLGEGERRKKEEDFRVRGDDNEGWYREHSSYSSYSF